jgi:hypothetical protein
MSEWKPTQLEIDPKVRELVEKYNLGIIIKGDIGEIVAFHKTIFGYMLKSTLDDPEYESVLADAAEKYHQKCST